MRVRSVELFRSRYRPLAILLRQSIGSVLVKYKYHKIEIVKVFNYFQLSNNLKSDDEFMLSGNFAMLTIILHLSNQ